MILYFLSLFLEDRFGTFLSFQFNRHNYIWLIIHSLSVILFLRHIWKDNTKIKKSKINNSLMILLLGFIIPYWVTGSFFEWLKERKKK